MCIGLYVQYRYSDFSATKTFSIFQKILKYKILSKSFQWQARGQTDRYGESNNPF